jgi:hypothetical protein
MRTSFGRGSHSKKLYNMSRLLQFFLIITFTSCIKEFEAPIPELPKALTVNCLFNPDSLFKVNVSVTSSMQELPLRLNDAQIVVYKNGTPIAPFENIGNGWYLSNTYPEVDAHYRIEVSAPNFDAVWAESYVPRYPEIIGQPESKIVGLMNRFGENRLVRDLHFTFKDMNTQNNYYEFFFDHRPDFHVDRVSDESILNDSDLDLINRPVNSYSIYFSNSLFRGEEKTAVLAGIISDYLDIPTIGQYPYVHLKFSSVSHNYYLYRKSLSRHLNNMNRVDMYFNPLDLLFIGSPQELYTNVHGGRGVFAGYNMRQIDALIEY